MHWRNVQADDVGMPSSLNFWFKLVRQASLSCVPSGTTVLVEACMGFSANYGMQHACLYSGNYKMYMYMISSTLITLHDFKSIFMGWARQQLVIFFLVQFQMITMVSSIDLFSVYQFHTIWLTSSLLTSSFSLPAIYHVYCHCILLFLFCHKHDRDIMTPLCLSPTESCFPTYWSLVQFLF